MRPGQNGRNFAEDTFKCIFLSENYYIRLKFYWSLSLMVIDDKPRLIQTMAWYQTVDKPWYEPTVA